MGLHKLGSELPESATARELSQAFGHKWTRADRRETGRRVWWLLLELDLNASPEHDFLYSADIGERVCAMPANVNDDELRGQVSIASRPITEHTDMTFICSRLTFLGPLKRFVKAVNQVGGRLTEAIMEKTEIQPVTPTQDSLPMQGMDASSMKQITAEARAIKCYGYSAALRLHRLCLAPSLHGSFPLAGDQGISFSVDTLNTLLPGTVYGYHQEFDDPLQALLQGTNLNILENFLLYPPQSAFEID
ncbi:hypothetical protein QFC22_005199 [Naganishia vaughanmartiniae]|uniref:Uncharacterized protein n=1 Tax=Naganishia vaughanmartiniae TaxID=1424756 RepID=A0ACC2WWC5_9TREE|nr:hypothetical protein QFC22_005199 [Naganishia vaughanmartiniae]